MFEILHKYMNIYSYEQDILFFFEIAHKKKLRYKKKNGV